MTYVLMRPDINSGNPIDLGTITNEHPSKQTGIVVLPEPTAESSNTRAIDFAGAVLNVNLSGTLVDDNQANLLQKVAKLFAFANGNQTTTSTYISDILGTKNVKVINVEGDYNGGEPTKFEYKVQLVEASTDI